MPNAFSFYKKSTKKLTVINQRPQINTSLDVTGMLQELWEYACVVLYNDVKLSFTCSFHSDKKYAWKN